ncbi:MAG: hypothetical protein EAX96_10475 [Candidatus Lokiarchaeota archaeon]|nr:hypothetical protein [Candidatus Lokiarchaeota archaeon]
MKLYKFKIFTLIFISLVLFVSFMPFIPNIPYNSNEIAKDNGDKLPNDDFFIIPAGAGSEIMDPYTGSGGSGITIMEQGIQSNSRINIQANSTDNLSITVNNQNWDGTSVNATINSLQETGQWIQNENFDGDSNWIEHNEVQGVHVGDDFVNEHNSTMSHTADGTGSREIVLIGESGELSNDIRIDQRNGEINQYSGTSWFPDFYNWTETVEGIDQFAYEDAMYVNEYTKGNTSVGSASISQSIDLYQGVNPLDYEIDYVEIDYSMRLYAWRLSPGGTYASEIRGMIHFGSASPGTLRFFKKAIANFSVELDDTGMLNDTIYIEGTEIDGLPEAYVSGGFEIIAGAGGPQQTRQMGWLYKLTCRIYYKLRIETNAILALNQTSEFSSGFQGRDITDAFFSVYYRGDRLSGATTYYPYIQFFDENSQNPSQKMYLRYASQTVSLDSSIVNDGLNWYKLEAHSSDIKAWFNARSESSENGPFVFRIGLSLETTDISLDSNYTYYFDDLNLTLVADLDPGDAAINLKLLDHSNGLTADFMNGTFGTGTLVNPILSTYSSGNTFDFGFNTSIEVFDVSLNAEIMMNVNKLYLASYNFTAPSLVDSSKVGWWVDHTVTSTDLNDISDYQFNITTPEDWEPIKVLRPAIIPETYQLKNITNNIYVEYSGLSNSTVQFYESFSDGKNGTWSIFYHSPNYVDTVNPSQLIYYLGDLTHFDINLTLNLNGRYMVKTWRIQDSNDEAVLESLNNQTGTNSGNFSLEWTIPNTTILNYIGKFRIDTTWNNSDTGFPLSKVGCNNQTVLFYAHSQADTDFYAIDSSLVLPGDIYLQPQFLKFIANWSTALTDEDQKISEGTMYLNYTTPANNAANYTLFNEYGTGNYSIDFSTLNLKNGTQEVQLILQKKYFETIIVTHQITQAIDMVCDVLAPLDVRQGARFTELFYKDDYNISLRLRNVYENLAPYTNSSGKLKIIIRDYNNPEFLMYFNKNPSDATGNNYYVTIPATYAQSQGRDYLYFNVTIYFNEQILFETIQFNVTIKVTWEDTLIWYAETPVIPFKENTSIVIFAENLTDTGEYTSGPLEGATIYIQNVTNPFNPINVLDFNCIENPIGTYNITINTSNSTRWPVGLYQIKVFVNKSYHYNHSLTIPLNIRNVTTSLTYTPPGILPWTDQINATMTLTFQDLDRGIGIPGADIYLTEVTNNPGDIFVFNQNWTYTDNGDGTYLVEIEMDNMTLDEIYSFDFEASLASYKTASIKNVNLTARSTYADLDIEGSLSKLIVLGQYNITMEYWDIENTLKISNLTGSAPVFINYTCYSKYPGFTDWVYNSTLQLNSRIYQDSVSGINNTWRLNINTTGFNTSLIYLIAINASKQNYQTSFENVTISLRKSDSRIGATTPFPTVFNDSVEFYVSYTDESGNSQFGPATNIYLYWWNSSSMWEPVSEGTGSWVQEYGNSIPDLSNGNEVKITFNTSVIPLPDIDIGYHRINITIEDTSGTYATQSIEVRIFIRPIDTQILYTPPSIVQIGANTTLILFYQDTAHNVKINETLWNQLNISVDLDNNVGNGFETGYYSVMNDFSSGNYLIKINTSHWNSAGTYPIQVFVNWSGTPYYKNNTLSFNLIIRNISTEILYEPPGQIAWGHNITSLKIQYHDTDDNTYPDIKTADTTVYLNNVVFPNSSITYEATTNSYYLNNIDTDTWTIGTHDLNITVVKTNYEPTERIIPITIRRHNTELLYTPPGQVPWGKNVSLTIQYHDIDDDEYPEMTMNSTSTLVMNFTYNNAIRQPDGSYIINQVSTYSLSLGTYVIKVTVTNNSEDYDNATAYISVTIRNISTFLTYEPPGITPYSATENATFTITYEDEFGSGIDAATINLTLKYIDGGSPGSLHFIYNNNWTYSNISTGTYKISITMENLSTNLIYTFQINVSKTNYVSRSISKLNLTLRDTFTRLRSPYAPSSILPEGLVNITIYYEDREASVGISNETSETYHVNMDWSWDHTSMQDNSTFYQVGSGINTYWVIQINTSTFISTFGSNQIYNLSINASKQYYESQELRVSVKLSLNIPILGLLPPESTVWGENVTFNITYTTIDGQYISNANVTVDWPSSHYSVYDYEDGNYKITINTSGKPVPNPAIGYYLTEVNVTHPSYDLVSQTFYFRIRPIDTQILYEAPAITPISENVTFALTYKDTFHSVNIYAPEDISISINISSTHFSWVGNPGDETYELSIDTDYWDQAGTYTIEIKVNWTGTDPINKYQNKSMIININVRDRQAQLSYDPIGTVPLGQNISLVIQYKDLDLNSYPILFSNNITINQSQTKFGDLTGPINNKYTITEIDVSRLGEGNCYLNISIELENYTTVYAWISFNIRNHSAELSYIPIGIIPWGQNISLTIQFYDLDNNSYPTLSAENIRINNTNINFGGLIGPDDNKYTITDIDVQGLPLGSYYFEIIIELANYTIVSKNISFTIRAHLTEFTYEPVGTTHSGSNISLIIQLLDLDNNSFPTLSESNIDINSSLINFESLTGPINNKYTITEIKLDHLEEGTYYLYVTIQITNYTNSSRLITVTIRDHAPELTYEPIGSIPVGENTSLVIQYFDLDNNTYPTLFISDIRINDTDISFGELTGPISNKYTITDIDIANLNIGKHYLNISIVKENYTTIWKIISITIRAHSAELTYDPIGSVIISSNFSLVIQFYDIDNGSYPILNSDNIKINTSLIGFTGISGPINNEYTIMDIDVDNLAVGNHYINLSVEVPNYTIVLRSIPFTIRKHYAELTYEPIGAISWGKNISLVIQFYDLDNESYPTLVSGNVKINDSSINFESLTGPVSNKYTIDNIGVDYLPIGSHLLNLTIEIIDYSAIIRMIPLTIRAHLIELSYEPVGNIPWGHNVTSLRIQYYDIDNNSYPNITALDTVVYIDNIIFTNIEYDQPNQTYILNDIDTDSWDIGLNSLNITIIKQDYDDAERIFNINIRKHTTELLYTPPGQVAWGSKHNLTIKFHDIDDNSYPEMDLNNTFVLFMNFSYLYAYRQPDNSYLITNLSSETLPIGNYVNDVFITNYSHLYDTAHAAIPITIRNVSTYLTYEPAGITPYSSTENATFIINYEDEFGLGIVNATVNLELKYIGGVSPGSTNFIYNENWTYSSLGNGEYRIQVAMENLSTNLIYTFQVNASKANYIARTLSKVNITLRDTYTRLRSPQAPNSILPEGVVNITIYYEDREAGVGISNETGELYHVAMDWSWDHTSMQENSTFYQVGSGSNTYWIIQINTSTFISTFGSNQIYNLTINASKQYYEWQQLNISIKLSLNIPILGLLPPESTVWGENVTFNITYTTIDGQYIPSANVTIDWPDSHYSVYDYGNGNYNITINTTGKPVPNPKIGYYITELNITHPSYDLISQSFYFRIRPIDTQILYEAPAITPISKNVTFALTYRDTFHSVDVYVPENIDLTVNISSMYYSWVGNVIDETYILSIDTDYWNQAGTYPIMISINWTGSDPLNKYQNQTIILNINVRDRIAELSYDPIGSIPWGENTSLTFSFLDLDLGTYVTTLSSDNITVRMNGSLLNFGGFSGPVTNKFTITDIDVANNLSIGLYVLNLTIELTNYSLATRNITFTIRAHSAELDYEPLGSVAFSENTTLILRFRDVDSLVYPDINLGLNLSMVNNETGQTISYGSITSIGDISFRYFEINDLNISGLDIGSYILNITVFNSSYDKRTRYIPLTIRERYTSLAINLPAGIIAYGNIAKIEIQWSDDDIESGDKGLNVTYGNFNISLIYEGENWLEYFPGPGSNPYNTTAWWEYGSSQGIYVLYINTSWLDGINDNFLFKININHSSGNYENSSINTNVGTRYRSTYLTVDNYQSPVYGENLTIYLRYYDMDNVSGTLNFEEEISGAMINYTDSGIYDYTSTINPYYKVVINTSEFITSQRNEIHVLNLTVFWPSETKPFYSNQSISINIICREIDTYHKTYFNDTLTESFSGWSWGTDINITLEYYYAFYSSFYNLSNSYIDLEAPGVYSDLFSNMTLWGLKMDGTWENITLSKQSETGIFRVELNGSVPENNQPYVFNVSLYQSTSSDEMFRNQTFSFVITFTKAFTAISITFDPDVYIPWGTNMTLRVYYFNVETGAGVNDPNAEVTWEITSIQGNSSYVDIGSIPINVIKVGGGYWNVTMNTTWTDTYGGSWIGTPKIYFRIAGTAVNVANSWQDTSVYIREIRTRLDYIIGSSLVYTDEQDILYFNATYYLFDVDSGQPIEDYGNPTGRYANLTFWYWDNVNDLYNNTNWGTWNTTHWYGQFNVTNLGGGYYKFNFSFVRNMTTNGPYQMKIKVNGTHLSGPTLDQEYAINFNYWVTLRIKYHHTNITLEKDSMPQVNEWIYETWNETNTKAPNNVTYGEKLNITLFWYDLDQAATYINQTGIEFGAFNVTATIEVVWGISEAHIIGAYQMYNMYITTNNDTYKGIYVVEFDTGYFARYYELADIVNGGPWGDGTYNLTIRFWLLGASFDPEYQLAIIKVPVKILPVQTILSPIAYTDFGGNPLPITNNGTIVPFGTTGSTELFYTTWLSFNESLNSIEIPTSSVFSSMVSVYFENYTNGSPDSTLVTWEPIIFDRIPSFQVRIFTGTEWIINDDWIPFNASGHKEVNITIVFSKPNYENASVTMLVVFRKHGTTIQYFQTLDDILPSQFNGIEVKYRYNATIYFRYYDYDYDESKTSSEDYIRWGIVSSNWTFDWGIIQEIPEKRGWYRIVLDANTAFNIGEYWFTINISDSRGFRENASVIWNVTILQASTDFNITAISSQVQQFFESISINVYYADEFGQPITDATLTYIVYSNGQLITSGILTGGTNGIYSAQISTSAISVMPFQVLSLIIVINATPSSGNFAGHQEAVTVNIVSIFLNPLAIVLEIVAAGIIGFFGYKQIKWARTPYEVKQIIRTRKKVNKGKELKDLKIVKDRKELFKEEFVGEWNYISLKAPSMVPPEVIAFADELSRIKRTRVTATEANEMINKLKTMTLEEAESYLEHQLMVPPEARKNLLRAGKIIDVKNLEIVKLTELISNLKDTPYTYEYCEELHSKLIKMSPEAASDYLWKSLLLSRVDRISVLQTIGMPVAKLKKKLKNKLESLSEKEIKKELKKLSYLTVTEKERECDKILKMEPKKQRKYLEELNKTLDEKHEKKRKAKEEDKGLTREEIEKELKDFNIYTDAEIKMMAESIMFLGPEERRNTLESMKIGITEQEEKVPKDEIQVKSGEIVEEKDQESISREKIILDPSIIENFLTIVSKSTNVEDLLKIISVLKSTSPRSESIMVKELKYLITNDENITEVLNHTLIHVEAMTKLTKEELITHLNERIDELELKDKESVVEEEEEKPSIEEEKEGLEKLNQDEQDEDE